MDYLKTISFVFLTFFSIILSANSPLFAQENAENYSDAFTLKKIKYGVGGSLGMGNGYQGASLDFSFIYQATDMLGYGFGMQGNYLKKKNFFVSYIYGVSLIGIVNPLPEIQLSAELEQLRVNSIYKTPNITKNKANSWNTSLFIGVGYDMKYATIGIRYNVLYNNRNIVYGSPFMPFFRVYF